MFKSLSLRIKILSVSLVLAALLAGINYYQIYSIQHLSSLLRLVDTGFAQEIILNNVQLNGAQLVDQTSDYVHAIADEGLTVAQATKQADKVTITNNTLKQSAAQYKRLLT